MLASLNHRQDACATYKCPAWNIDTATQGMVIFIYKSIGYVYFWSEMNSEA